MLEKGG